MAPVVRRPVGPDEPSASWPRSLVDQLAPAADEPVGPAGDLGGEKILEGKKRRISGGDSTRFLGDLEVFFESNGPVGPVDLVKITQIRSARPVGPGCVGQLAPSEMLRRPVGPVGLGGIGEKRRVSQLAPGRQPVGPHQPSTSWPPYIPRPVGPESSASWPRTLLDQLVPTNRRPVDPQWTW